MQGRTTLLQFYQKGFGFFWSQKSFTLVLRAWHSQAVTSERVYSCPHLLLDGIEHSRSAGRESSQDSCWGQTFEKFGFDLLYLPGFYLGERHFA